jgi:hypothetical protein
LNKKAFIFLVEPLIKVSSWHRQKDSSKKSGTNSRDNQGLNRYRVLDLLQGRFFDV